MFHAADSTLVGVAIAADFDGDTTGYWPTRATLVVELVDSATGLRVDLLDSFCLSTTDRTHKANVSRSLDLLSGTYYVRSTIDTVSCAVPVSLTDSRYAVGEFAVYVDDTTALFKNRRLEPAKNSSLRVTTHPNPAQEKTEARFSVREPSRVIVILANQIGSMSSTLIDEWLQPGRYAVEIDTRNFVPGAYYVNVRAGDASGTSTLIVSH